MQTFNIFFSITYNVTSGDKNNATSGDICRPHNGPGFAKLDYRIPTTINNTS